MADFRHVSPVSALRASRGTVLALVMTAVSVLPVGCKYGRKLVEASPPPGAAGDVIFATSFESSRWYWSLGVDEPPDTTRTVDADGNGFKPLSGRALRITVPKGAHAGVSNLNFYFGKHIGKEPEEVYFRYYLRLGRDWKPVTAGKMPGIAGTYGRGGWGGRRADGRNGWSARGLFHKSDADGRLPVGFYCYHADMEGKVGTNWLWSLNERGRLERDRWYCIEQHVKLNTPRKNDGVLRAWVDGKLAFRRRDVRFRDVADLRIERVWLDVYHGGDRTAVHDHSLYIDDLVISRSYVGPRAR